MGTSANGRLRALDARNMGSTPIVPTIIMSDDVRWNLSGEWVRFDLRTSFCILCASTINLTQHHIRNKNGRSFGKTTLCWKCHQHINKFIDYPPRAGREEYVQKSL